jgi:hypothetical protein
VSAGRIYRRAQAPARVSLARLWSRPGRVALLLVGVAAAVGMFVGVLVGAVIARDLSLQQAVAGLPAAERSFRVDLVGLTAIDRRQDLAARRALAELESARPTRLVYYRDFWLDGQFVRFAGIDAPGAAVRLVSGRMPRTCEPQACEVLQIGSRGRARLDEGDIHLVRVGVGELHDPASFGPAFTGLRRQRAQASYPLSIVLLGPDSDAVDRLVPLRLLARTHSWVAPLRPSDLHEWQIDALLQRESRGQAALYQADPSFTLTGPDAALLDARERGDVYAHRTVLIGGAAAVALLGFAILAAVSLRRGLRAERRRLVQRGASRGQVAVAVLVEAGAIVVLGAALGIAAGALVTAAVAVGEGLPAAPTLRHALLNGRAAALLAAELVLALALVTWILTSDEPVERRPRLRPLDVAAIGAALAVAIGVSRGSFDPDVEASTNEAFLLLLPALIAFVGGVAAARLLGPVMALAERLARRGSIAVRLALLALARAPARTAATGAFLVVAIGLVVFAAAYRSTLERGARDQAAFSVPLDVTLSQGPSLFLPLDVASTSRYAHLAAGVHPYPVLRATADVAGVGTSIQAATALGIPSDALAAMHWRGDYAAAPRARLVRALRPDSAARLEGLRLPDEATATGLALRLRGAPLALDLVLQTASGSIERLPLGTAAPGRDVLSHPLGKALRRRGPLELLGVELELSPSGRAWLNHLGHEGRFLKAPSGSLSLDALTVTTPQGGRGLVRDWRGWVARGDQGSIARSGRGRLGVKYAFSDAVPFLLRPRQPTDGRPLRIVASPAVADAAGRGGLLTLDFYDTQVETRVVAVAKRFPTLGADEPFVIADGTALTTALDADAPGTGTPGELWLSVPDDQADTVTRALARPPYAGLEQLSRRRLSGAAEHEPLARGVVTTLGVTALVALVLALVGLWATVLGDLRDERDGLFDLEAQGAGPALLRKQMRIRTLALLAFGLLGGCALGFVLSRFVVSVVQVTATATHPDPPLVVDIGAGTVAPALGVLVLACLAAIEITLRHAFRGDVPERASWSLE